MLCSSLTSILDGIMKTNFVQSLACHSGQLKRGFAGFPHYVWRDGKQHTGECIELKEQDHSMLTLYLMAKVMVHDISLKALNESIVEYMHVCTSAFKAAED